MCTVHMPLVQLMPVHGALQATLTAPRGAFVGPLHVHMLDPQVSADGSKTLVVYRMRVRDDTGEWTVGRRRASWRCR